MTSVACVTGSNRGIGLEICKILAKKKWHVLMTSRKSSFKTLQVFIIFIFIYDLFKLNNTYLYVYCNIHINIPNIYIKGRSELH